MSKEENKAVPRLRFTEFESEKWCIEQLKEVYSFKSTNSFSREDLNYERGEVKNIHYGDIHTKFATQFNITKEKVPFINPSISIENVDVDTYCQEGDIIFADASEDLKDVGKSIEIVNLNNERLLSGMHTLLARRKQNKLIVGFGGYLFMADAIRAQIQREAQGTKVLGISAIRISNIEIFYPVDKKEQQKIADCLSSLDDLLIAENQKLEALKAHKKGLMQQLFPAEGETVPRLRFTEFRESGEWEERKLGNMLGFIMGNAFKSDDFIEDGLQLVRMGNLYQGELQLNRASVFLPRSYAKEYSQFLVKSSDLLMSMTGTLGKRDYGFVIQIPKISFDLLLNQRVLKIIPKENCIKEFVLQQLKHDIFLGKLFSIPGGTKQANLSTKDLSEIEIPFPKPKEQQKIADCLSSLDEFIAAQSDKIGALTEHKKGLMQGLFPNSKD